MNNDKCICEQSWLPIGGECCERCGKFVEPEKRLAVIAGIEKANNE